MAEDKTFITREDDVDYFTLGTILVDKVGDVRLTWLNQSEDAVEDAIKTNIKNNLLTAFKENLEYFGKHYFVAIVQVKANFTKGEFNLDDMRVTPIRVLSDVKFKNVDAETKLENALDTKSISDFNQDEFDLLKKIMFEDYLPDNVSAEDGE